MNKINPNSKLQGLQAAQEASADYRLEQKGSQRAKKTKSTSAANSELVRVAQDMGGAINKWDTQLTEHLEEWYQETEDLAELASDLNELTQELSDIADSRQAVIDAYDSLVPAKGDNKVLYEDEAAIEFAEAMVAAGLGYTVVFSNVTIGGGSAYYYTPNMLLKEISNYQQDHDGELPSIEVKVQPHKDGGRESPSPEALQKMIEKSIKNKQKFRT